MGGFGGITPEQYYKLSDRQILDSYLAEFDEDRRLVPLKRRIWNARYPDTVTGDPDRAGRELPSVESLDIPQEVLLCGVPMDYVLMWWSIWRKRATYNTEELLAKWWSERGELPPTNWNPPAGVN